MAEAPRIGPQSHWREGHGESSHATAASALGKNEQRGRIPQAVDLCLFQRLLDRVIPEIIFVDQDLI
jgi:hypothetical protein